MGLHTRSSSVFQKASGRVWGRKRCRKYQEGASTRTRYLDIAKKARLGNLQGDIVLRVEGKDRLRAE
jgi:hypothetical protein